MAGYIYIYIYLEACQWECVCFLWKREPRELFEDSLEGTSVKVLCIRSFTLISCTLLVCILMNTGFKTRIFNKPRKFFSLHLLLWCAAGQFLFLSFLLCWKHLRNASPQVFVGGIRSILQVTLHDPKAMIWGRCGLGWVWTDLWKLFPELKQHSSWGSRSHNMANIWWREKTWDAFWNTFCKRF